MLIAIHPIYASEQETWEEKYLLLQADVGEGIFFAGLKHAACGIRRSILFTRRGMR